MWIWCCIRFLFWQVMVASSLVVLISMFLLKFIKQVLMNKGHETSYLSLLDNLSDNKTVFWLVKLWLVGNLSLLPDVSVELVVNTIEGLLLLPLFICLEFCILCLLELRKNSEALRSDICLQLMISYFKGLHFDILLVLQMLQSLLLQLSKVLHLVVVWR